MQLKSPPLHLELNHSKVGLKVLVVIFKEVEVAKISSPSSISSISGKQWSKPLEMKVDRKVRCKFLCDKQWRISPVPVQWRKRNVFLVIETDAMIPC
jgi:hypothetical protein